MAIPIVNRDNEIIVADALQPESEQERGLMLGLRGHLARSGRALQHRNYRLFWFGQLISLIGTWMQSLAQAWLVLSLSNGNPFALGLVTALQFLPSTLLSLFSGAMADRYSKRRTLIITQASAMTLAAVLGLLTTTGLVQIWQIYICAFLLGTVNAFDMPTRQSFVSEMVNRENLLNAVALNSTIFNAARVVGPAVAGLLIGLGERIFNSTQAGAAFAIWLNAFSYIAVLIGLLKMRPAELFSPVNKPPTGSVLKSIKEGLSYIVATPAVLTLIWVVGMMGTFGFNFNVWIPVLTKERLGAGAEGFGVLMAGLGIGALASSLSLTLTRRKPSLRRIQIALLFFGLFEAGVALSGLFWLSFVLMIGTGLAMIQVGAASNSYVQMTTPDNMRGRVMGVYLFVFVGTTPLGSLFMGWLAALGGTPFAMFTGAVLSASAVPTAWLFRQWLHRRHAHTDALASETALN